MPTLNLCGCSPTDFVGVIQCKSCCTGNCSGSSINNENIEKIIQNQVRVSQSQLLDVKGAITIGADYLDTSANPSVSHPFQNMSDRREPHGLLHTNVPTRGNSLRSSITSNKPGSMAPGGKGVDVKHGSYARYLGKLKAPYLSRTETTILDNNTNIINNKQHRFSLVNANCKCNGISLKS